MTSPYRTAAASPPQPVRPGVHTEFGGLRWGKGRLGTVNATWPFARLRATPTQIQIRVLFPLLWRKFVLSRRDVVLVQKQMGVFNTGVRFQHDDKRCPECLLFWTFWPDRLLIRLSDLGYATLHDAAA